MCENDASTTCDESPFDATTPTMPPVSVITSAPIGLLDSPHRRLSCGRLHTFARQYSMLVY